jgi:type III pantothenate kinase
VTPDVLYEVGNTRIKCGRVAPDGTIKMSIFDPDLFDCEGLPRGPSRSVALVAGSRPEMTQRLVQWLRGADTEPTEVTTYTQLPITVDVENPETVGLDRLLGAVAANRRRTPGRAAVTVDVGTAATVNFVDADGVFRGGLILPGPTTMAKSLHTNTAKLPQLDDLTPFADQSFPSHPTTNAIGAGILYAIAGAVHLAMRDVSHDGVVPHLFLTGGGYSLIAPLLKCYKPAKVPALNLEGLFITAESLP